MILVAGDSWGCGEFSGLWKTHRITHGGFAQFLREAGHKVFNFSRGGGSNFESVSRIECLLDEGNGFKDSITKIFVFQTDWTRDCWPGYYNKITEKDLKESNYNFEIIRSRIVSRFYYNLRDISQRTEIPIYLIGGCADTLWLDRFELEYPGVQIACQSFVNLLLNQNHRVETPVLESWPPHSEQLIVYAKQHLDNVNLVKLLEDVDLGGQRRQQWRSLYEAGLFCEDSVHPNRQGHKVLFDFLSEKYSL